MILLIGMWIIKNQRSKNNMIEAILTLIILLPVYIFIIMAAVAALTTLNTVLNEIIDQF